MGVFFNSNIIMNQLKKVRITVGALSEVLLIPATPYDGVEVIINRAKAARPELRHAKPGNVQFTILER